MTIIPKAMLYESCIRRQVYHHC